MAFSLDSCNRLLSSNLASARKKIGSPCDMYFKGIKCNRDHKPSWTEEAIYSILAKPKVIQEFSSAMNIEINNFPCMKNTCFL